MNHRNWNQVIASLPSPHILQTEEWAQVKAPNGWHAHFLVWNQVGDGYQLTLFADAQSEDHIAAAAMMLFRSIKLGPFTLPLRVAYLSKGPLLDWKDDLLRKTVLMDMCAYARKNRAIFLKLDADVQLGTGIPGKDDNEEKRFGQKLQRELSNTGWQYSQDQIQFRNSVHIDLTADEDDMLRRMKQKTRYNVRYAERKGIVIREGTKDDLPMLYRMYTETAARDGFLIRDERYYLRLWQIFFEQEWMYPLIAEVHGEPVAALALLRFEKTAYYMHGMSTSAHRKLMPTYLLQWEAMRKAKNAGCTVYDLWGAPNQFDESDPMWGVYRFKSGLGGYVVRTLGAWDYPLRPRLYQLYTELMPRVLSWMRKRASS
jgi:lipid II:glycine glycyltransferase (peptidoglycan interpeptide bridge formation enzyme)